LNDYVMQGDYARKYVCEKELPLPKQWSCAAGHYCPTGTSSSMVSDCSAVYGVVAVPGLAGCGSGYVTRVQKAWVI
jgi:hypothetical protein